MGSVYLGLCLWFNLEYTEPFEVRAHPKIREFPFLYCSPALPLWLNTRRSIIRCASHTKWADSSTPAEHLKNLDNASIIYSGAWWGLSLCVECQLQLGLRYIVRPCGYKWWSWIKAPVCTGARVKGSFFWAQDLLPCLTGRNSNFELFSLKHLTVFDGQTVFKGGLFAVTKLHPKDPLISFWEAQIGWCPLSILLILPQNQEGIFLSLKLYRRELETQMTVRNGNIPAFRGGGMQLFLCIMSC